MNRNIVGNSRRLIKKLELTLIKTSIFIQSLRSYRSEGHSIIYDDRFSSLLGSGDVRNSFSEAASRKKLL